LLYPTPDRQPPTPFFVGALDGTRADSRQRTGISFPILAQDERVARRTPLRIEGSTGILRKYLWQGGDGTLWPEKGYKSWAQRPAEEEGKRAG
jgi:hypothetical protein